jgi:glycosyltransferase involved in cell wall biosynthesis
MRICVITVAGYVHGVGGMQDHTVDLVRGLAAHGHEVEVITARHPDGVERTEYARAVWHFVDAPTARQRLPMRHPHWHRASEAAFAALHAARPYDVVHSESTSALGLVHRDWHERVPLVVKFHGNYLSFVKAAARRIAARDEVVREAKGIVWHSGAHFLTPGNWLGFRSCEAMVPSWAQLEDTVRSHLLRRSRVHVVPNGLDPDVFSPGDGAEARAELGLGGGIVFLWLGRMYPGKGVDVAIRALAQAGGDARLVLVGDGESRSALEGLASSLGLQDRVLFAGAQPRERVPSYLRAADALVFPTRLPEAAGLAPLQAMACALPVVASRIGALPELVDAPGANGLLVEPDDEDALATALTLLARDAGLRAELGRRARERVLSDYTLDRMIERTTAVYDVARRPLELRVDGDGATSLETRALSIVRRFRPRPSRTGR